jgi:DnaJ-class molecular chaperone
MNEQDIDDRRLSPGDEAAPGAPESGDNICRECGGAGTLANGRICPMCEGLGRSIEAVAGG